MEIELYFEDEEYLEVSSPAVSVVIVAIFDVFFLSSLVSQCNKS